MKLSLRTLMLIVALVGVVTASLVQPSLFWMRLMFTVTTAFLALAGVGALAARGKVRTFWIGATVFGGAYVYVLISEHTIGFQQRSTMMQRALITQPLLDRLAQARGLDVRSHFADFSLWDQSIYTDYSLGTGGMGPMGGGGFSSPPGGGGFFDVDPERLEPSGGSTPPAPGSSSFAENSDAGAAGSMGPAGGMPMPGGPGMGSPGPPAGAPPIPPVWTYASYNHFLITGHCAFVILVGLIGGLVSRWAFAREEEGESRQ